jgi:hypothetical protein
MISTSAESRPNPKQFLTGYAANVEAAIQELQRARVPEEGDYALRGKEPRDIKSMAQSGVIQV